ncbi:M14 family metallopeptidase [Pseudoalteromonas denitrificans]|uniref:Zinc carboxypeptidase n=1 Tax=Pseudoalteromonas denitrificans DSM 6059 TaxID=1123010 RepID=A0A1I1KLS1_9GAMM|nr:M14-type cytosolic carboxypeptidase [Pseudoalteromonas denitrificans]SFC61934.1 Zinc carboxypeptidase [Pseudoalteromonas denitrificans DSM 6059]
MKITHKFDSGSIEVVEISDKRNIKLKLIQDNQANISQWFHFKLETTQNELHTIKILNAGKSSFSDAWEGYQAVASYDHKTWFRVDTQFKDNQLIIKHIPKKSTISYAYFVPYNNQRQQDLLRKATASPICRHSVLGLTHDDNNLDLLIFGKEAKHKNKVWLIARQHPGETMAHWFVEGLILRLISGDELANQLLEDNVFYIVPNMNPDGTIRGNHRTNAKGFNLNRHWHKPSEIDTPEVFYVQQAMKSKGVDLFLDIHGDEKIPYSFIMPANTSCKLSKQAIIFKHNFVKANNSFQTEVDYNTFDNKSSCCGSSCNRLNDTYGAQNLTKASDYVANKFNCLSMILEMPFINTDSPIDNRCITKPFIQLGFDIAEPIYQHFSH